MKIFAILAASILATTASAKASVSTLRSPISNQVVTLETVAIDSEPTSYVGQLIIDDANDKLTLRIFDDPCGSLKPTEGKMHCMAVASLVVEMSVPIIERTFPCGSVQISGFEDLSPVDGLRTEIEYVNHSSRLCKDIVPDLIAVEASTFNPWDNKTTLYSLKTKR